MDFAKRANKTKLRFTSDMNFDQNYMYQTNRNESFQQTKTIKMLQNKEIEV